MNTSSEKTAKHVEATRTAETCEAYKARAKDLLRRSGAINHAESAAQISALIDWLEAGTWQWKTSTRRLYRAALIYVFTNVYNNDPDTDKSEEAQKEISRLLEYLRGQFMWRGNDGLPDRTSAKKRKYVTVGERNLLVSVLLENDRSQYAMPLVAWIIAGEAAGPRPNEWPQARIKQYLGSPHLVIRNLKTTNGRGNGKIRSQNLDSVSDLARISARALERLFRSHTPQEGMTILSGMRKQLYRICKALWPNEARTIALYTMRHQFSANGKASGFSPIKLAAAMGHASPKTAQTHYGRKGKGRRALSTEAGAETDMIGIAEPSVQDCLQLMESLDAKQASADAQKQSQSSIVGTVEPSAADARQAAAVDGVSGLPQEPDGDFEP